MRVPGNPQTLTISETMTIPNQPNVGNLEYVPLGGNGWEAPQSAWMLDMHITGDASGGFLLFTVNRDDRFEHLVQFMSIEVIRATTIPYRFDLFRSNATEIHNFGETDLCDATGLEATGTIWTPPPMINPIKFATGTTNVDLELVRFKLLLYNFNIRASEKVPLSVLLASLPRAASAI